jgi:hypothetical protein
MCKVCGTELKIARIKANAAGVTIPKKLSTVRDGNETTAWHEIWAPEDSGRPVWTQFTCCAYDAKRQYIEHLTDRHLAGLPPYQY